MRSPASDYRKKLSQEAGAIARRLKKAGHDAPLGDPASGIVIVVEQPVGPRIISALQRSLETIGLHEAYVTWTSTGLLKEELLSLQPPALVSLGPEASHEIDALDYPLARNSFSDATPGVWFSWTSSAAGLSLPALAPALSDPDAKKSFWRAFLALRRIAPPAP